MWHLAVLHTMADEFCRYELRPDVDTASEMLQRAEAWWARHVLAGDPPPVDGSGDARKWLLSRYPREREPLRLATAAEAMWAEEVARLRADAKRIASEEKAAAARLTAAIGAAEGVDLGGGRRVTWRAQSSNRIDVGRLRAEEPGMAARFAVETITRVLRVPEEER